MQSPPKAIELPALTWCVSWLKTVQQHGITSRILSSFSRDTIALKNSNGKERRAPNYYILSTILCLSLNDYFYLAFERTSVCLNGARARIGARTNTVSHNVHNGHSVFSVLALCRFVVCRRFLLFDSSSAVAAAAAAHICLVTIYHVILHYCTIKTTNSRWYYTFRGSLFFLFCLLALSLFPSHFIYYGAHTMSWWIRECAQSVASRRRFVLN